MLATELEAAARKNRKISVSFLGIASSNKLGQDFQSDICSLTLKFHLNRKVFSGTILRLLVWGGGVRTNQTNYPWIRHCIVLIIIIFHSVNESVVNVMYILDVTVFIEYHSRCD